MMVGSSYAQNAAEAKSVSLTHLACVRLMLRRLRLQFTASESCVSVLFDTLFELLEIVALRLCGKLIRRLFLGLSDSSTSIVHFFDLTTLFPDLLACVRCAASAAFCALELLVQPCVQPFLKRAA